MLQVTLLHPAGGRVTPVLTYPFKIGRAAGDQLRIQEPGVWDAHCTLEWQGDEGIHLIANAQAITSVNGQTVQEIRVRNGDLVELGGARLLLSVRPVPQRSFRVLEVLVWLTLAGVGLTQVFLMLWGLP